MKKIFINSAMFIKSLTDNFEDKLIGRTIIEMVIAHVLHSKEFNLTDALIEYSGNELLSHMVSLNSKHEMKVLIENIRVAVRSHDINSFHVSNNGVIFYVNHSPSHS